MARGIAVGTKGSPPASRPRRSFPADENRGFNFMFSTEVAVAKEEGVEVEGLVTEVLPDRMYRVRLENGHTVLAYGAGKMSKFKIRVLQGDRVTLSLSPYDLSRGRITYRHKS